MDVSKWQGLKHRERERASDPCSTERAWTALVLGRLLKSRLCSGQECDRKQHGDIHDVGHSSGCF